MEVLRDIAAPVLAILAVAVVVVAAAHAVLTKHDHRAAVGWLGVIVALPVLGALLYYLLGVNRVRRRAYALYRGQVRYPRPRVRVEARSVLGVDAALVDLSEFIDRVTAFPLVAGNRVTPLADGDGAFPAMLRAIDRAERSIALETYIFDRDAVGERFVDALGRAVERGVEVRVLIDAIGARYSFPTIRRRLRQRGVRSALFNRTTFPWRWTYANLRTHRKLLLVDGRVGFTGGLNIRACHVLADRPRRPTADLHFELEGPVVAQMQMAFCEDWAFATREQLGGAPWFPELAPVGSVVARGIIDGPDVDIDKLRWAVFGALACARRRVRIVTPYFLPETEMVAAIRTAVLRGVEIEILIPSRNNQVLVQWACAATLPQILTDGCRVWETLGPFDHTKIMVVDDSWVLLGSANLDPRSLRLNFEFNVECYNTTLATHVHGLVDAKLTQARPITLEGLARRSLPVRLRDGLARLLIPYL